MLPRVPLPQGRPPWPESDARPRRSWPLVLGLVAALLLTGLVAAGVVVGSRTADSGAPVGVGSSASPSSTPVVAPPVPTSVESPGPVPLPPPTATSSGEPPVVPLPAETPTPSATPGPDRSLRTNAAYTVDLSAASASCDIEVRPPRPPLANRRLAPYLREVVSCLTEVFAKPLAARGFVLREPTVATYGDKVTTPCGTFGQKGSPAYYCSATRTIYWPDASDEGRQAYTFARLGYVALTAHEFGHHLQASTGMLAEYAGDYAEASAGDRLVLSRRLELQAQCFEGVFLTVARRTLDLRSEDREELRTWHSFTGDEDPPKTRKADHGTSKAQYRWLERGLDSANLATCNTWTAEASDVT